MRATNLPTYKKLFTSFLSAEHLKVNSQARTTKDANMIDRDQKQTEEENDAEDKDVIQEAE